MTQMKPQVRLINTSIQESQEEMFGGLSPGLICVKLFFFFCGGEVAGSTADVRPRPTYLVLLLEAVALGALHLRDVLEEVGHADRRVQLPRLVRHVHGLPLPQGVGVGLHQAAGVAPHVLTLICIDNKKTKKTKKKHKREAGAG